MIVLVGVALALTGCGKGESAATTEKHLAVAANALCRHAHREDSAFARYNPPSLVREVIEWPPVHKLDTLLETKPELPPVKGFLSAFKIREVAEAGRDAKPPEGAEQVHIAEAAQHKIESELRALGMNECAQRDLIIK